MLQNNYMTVILINKNLLIKKNVNPKTVIEIEMKI